MFASWRARFTLFRRPPCIPGPEGECPLSGCEAGAKATVLCLGCPAADAVRLRTLGMFEGARIAVVCAPRGVLVDVRGARIALDRRTAGTITVRREVA